jgi:hypothetical protein
MGRSKLFTQVKRDGVLHGYEEPKEEADHVYVLVLLRIDL